MTRILIPLAGLALAGGLLLGLHFPMQRTAPPASDAPSPVASKSTAQAGRALPPLGGVTLASVALVPSKGNAGTTAITAVWANDGEDKVTQNELRAKTGSRAVLNRIWDGQRVHIFGAKNEVVAFNLVLEAADGPANGVSVAFDTLANAEGFRIHSRPAKADGVFNWVGRNIELFLVKYLQIKGLSRLSYETYDERHIPERFRRPKSGNDYVGGWSDRPDHDKFYPDIAVPMELSPQFDIAAHQNQSVWVDVYIPKDAPAGLYTGEVRISEKGTVTYRVPVELNVRNFALPDMPVSKTMVDTSYHDVALRYTGVAYPTPGSPEDLLTRQVMERQMMLAHRHKISLIDDNSGADAWKQTRPRPEWDARLSGALFTAANGYDGPGVGVGNNVFSIGTYGLWQVWWGKPSREAMWDYTNQWEQWFETHAPETERFLYLADESKDYAQTEKWAGWMKANPGVGSKLKSFATIDLLKAQKLVPSLDIAASWFTVGDTALWQSAIQKMRSQDKQLFLYNGERPASGSFAIEDDGVALRELPWGQYKEGIDRWFYWEATYYNDYQGGRGETDVFKNAQTFGGPPKPDPALGMTGWNYSNGDGVLFYPGIDKIFPKESLGLEGPIASLRLKYWRRGIQDVDYIAMAAKKDPKAVAEIIQRMVPKVLWENGVADLADPTWVRVPVSWSSNPDDWEAAREQLADIIEGRSTRRAGVQSDRNRVR